MTTLTWSLRTVIVATLCVPLVACTSPETPGPARASNGPVAGITSSTQPTGTIPAGSPWADLVMVGKVTVDSVSLFPSATVEVINHSAVRSDYAIDVALESANGKRQLDTTTIGTFNLEPGQSAFIVADFLNREHPPQAARLSVKTIQRVPSH